MNMSSYYLGIDQGTTGTMAILFDKNWHEVARGYQELPLLYPQIGWVEHDPEAVWDSVLSAASQALQCIGASASSVLCIGLNHEGESVVIWDRDSGKPIYNAIVWQDKRTAHSADEIADLYNDMVRSKSGLMIDAYFSATKYKWILDSVPDAREKMQRGRLMAGTLDTWILWKMSGGKAHVTDASTASRTLLYNLESNQWDDDLISVFDLDKRILPEIRDSAGLYCYTDPECFLGASIPVSAVLVDQQAALVGQGCIEPGSIKVTYGTGCWMQMNTGTSPVLSDHGLLPTVAWRLAGETRFALDGGVYSTGGATKWLKDGLGIIASPAETDLIATSTENNGGVYFVPAFTGLAAPHWDSYASGMVIGINGGTKKEHIVRAALESTAYQVRDVMDVMIRDASVPIMAIRCNGGPTRNQFLMQFQADILGIPLEIPKVSNATALGSAFMGALGIGHFDSVHNISEIWKLDRRYEPQMSADHRNTLLYHWHRAVERAKYWVE